MRYIHFGGYPATSQPCARPFMLMRPIQAHSCMFAHAPVHACAPNSRAHLLLKAIFSHAPDSRAHLLLKAIFSHALSRVFQEPKTLKRV